MLDLANKPAIMVFVDREDKAMLRSTLSARSMPGDGRGHGDGPMLLSSCPSLGSKAINLIVRYEAHHNAKTREIDLPVGHMSISSNRRAGFRGWW